MQKLKTWVEINKKAVASNIEAIKSLLRPKTKLWSVVKSNAYGHGLADFAKIADDSGVSGFCVDSVQEGLKLRKNGVKKPILTLGPTLFPELFIAAQNNNIAVTVSNFDILAKLLKIKNPPQFHLKIDTGMHRQGFYSNEVSALIKLLKKSKVNCQKSLVGIYTHFASAKDLNYPTYTDLQFSQFEKITKRLENSGFKNLIRHAAATGGTLINQKYHLDAVRVGIGLYGLWPSKELFLQIKNLKLKPVLSWHTLVSEVKNLKKWDYVGYDLAERVSAPSKIAILPIGYWHGFPRGLSGIGEVLINGRRAKILGRVSMDLIVANVTGIPCKTGYRATIIGRQKNEEISAFEIAQKLGTIHYELVTRINPLIERIVK